MNTNDRFIAALFYLAATPACFVQLGVEPSSQISCDMDSDCPTGWSCDRDRTQLCVFGSVLPSRCGDGFIDSDESCDCGDGKVPTPADCIGPNDNKGPNRCRSDCQAASCGDGAVDSAEECDDGNTMSGDGCAEDCVRERCGNGIVDAGEICDEGGVETERCTADCLSDKSCGNAYVDAGEACDCGAGFTALGCLHENGDPAGSCTATCQRPRCGDALVQAEEACDLGDDAEAGNGNGNGCNRLCSSEEQCGDGFLDLNEACDLGANNSDEPLMSFDAACRSDCQRPRCGDLIIDTSEVCDGGDACAANCQALCGDGVVGGLETCDPGGGATDADVRGLSCENFGWYRGALGCAPDCSALDFSACNGFCGDAVVDVAAGESCDGDAATAFSCRNFGARGPISCTARCQLSDERCFSGGWRTINSGVLDSFTDVSGISNADIWIVGSADESLHVSDGLFTAHPMPTSRWNAVHAIAPDDAWAVGELGAVAHYDGEAWTIVSTGGETFRDVTASGANDVWAVGEHGRVAHFDGVTFADVPASPLTGNNLLAVFALGPSAIYVAGAAEIWSFDGMTWTRELNDSGLVFQTLALGPSGALWAAGNNGVFRSSLPASGVWASHPSPTPNVITDFATPAGTPPWLVGLNGTIARLEPSGWAPAASPTSRSLNAVFAASPNDLLAVGDEGTLLQFRGAGFEVVRPPGSLPSLALHGTAADDLWTVGVNGQVAHLSGAGVQTESLSVTSETLNGVAAVSGGVVWAVGNEGTVVHRQAGLWSLVPTGVTTRLTRVSAVSATEIWAAGDSRVLHWDGAATVYDLPFFVRALWVSAAGDVWIGGDGVLARKSGEAFVPVPIFGQDYNSSFSINALWGVGSSDVWALASNGILFHWDGLDVEAPASQLFLGPGPTALVGTGANDVWFGGDSGGSLAHYDGTDVAEVPSATQQGIAALYADSQSNIWALALDGSLLRLSHAMPSALGGACFAPALVSCGSHRFGNTRGAPAGFDSVSSASCGAVPTSGLKRYLRLDVPAGVRVTATLSPIEADLDLVALAGTQGQPACDVAGCLAASSHSGTASESIVLDDTTSIDHVFFIVYGAESSFDFDVSCQKRASN